jgi:hypothetical protein
VGEHNVIRDGEWIVRFVDGEFRYNVVTDIIDHDLMQNGSTGRIHHNLFLAGRSDSRPGSMFGCIAVIYPPKQSGEGIEIFNNVFDGGGWMNVPAVEVAPGAFVKSLRNNVFFNFAHKEAVQVTFYEFTSLIAPRPLLVGQAVAEPTDGRENRAGCERSAGPWAMVIACVSLMRRTSRWWDGMAGPFDCDADGVIGGLSAGKTRGELPQTGLPEACQAPRAVWAAATRPRSIYRYPSYVCWVIERRPSGAGQSGESSQCPTLRRLPFRSALACRRLTALSGELLQPLHIVHLMGGRKMAPTVRPHQPGHRIKVLHVEQNPRPVTAVGVELAAAQRQQARLQPRVIDTCDKPPLTPDADVASASAGKNPVPRIAPSSSCGESRFLALDDETIAEELF